MANAWTKGTVKTMHTMRPRQPEYGRLNIWVAPIFFVILYVKYLDSARQAGVVYGNARWGDGVTVQCCNVVLMQWCICC